MSMLLGVVGIYRKNETVDVQFQKNGKTELAGDLKIESLTQESESLRFRCATLIIGSAKAL